MCSTSPAERRPLVVQDEVRAIACGLHALGLGNEQRVAIVANTRWEWIVVDLAILCAATNDLPVVGGG
jgi:long-subunit acyl-CoA synthetase (AMP-forming)